MKNSVVVFLRWLYLAFFFLFFITIAYFCFEWAREAFSKGNIFFGILRVFLSLFCLLLAGVIQFNNGQGLAADTTGRIPCGIPLKVEYEKKIERYSNGKSYKKVILVFKDNHDSFLFFELLEKKFSTTQFPSLFTLEKNNDDKFIIHEIKT